MTTALAIMDELGEAFRNDDLSISGVGVQREVKKVTNAIRMHRDAQLPAPLAAQIRKTVALCQDGRGHWSDWCLLDADGQCTA